MQAYFHRTPFILTISVAALPLLRCFGVVEGVDVGVAVGVFLSVSLSSPLSSDDTLESDSSSISSQIAGNKVVIKLKQEKSYMYVYTSLCPKSPSVQGFFCIFTCSPVGLIRITKCILPSFIITTIQHLNWADKTGQKALCYMDLNNRRTGKHATKLGTLGLLGHSVHVLL